MEYEQQLNRLKNELALTKDNTKTILHISTEGFIEKYRDNLHSDRREMERDLGNVEKQIEIYIQYLDRTLSQYPTMKKLHSLFHSIIDTQASLLSLTANLSFSCFQNLQFSQKQINKLTERMQEKCLSCQRPMYLAKLDKTRDQISLGFKNFYSYFAHDIEEIHKLQEEAMLMVRKKNIGVQNMTEEEYIIKLEQMGDHMNTTIEQVSYSLGAIQQFQVRLEDMKQYSSRIQTQRVSFSRPFNPYEYTIHLSHHFYHKLKQIQKKIDAIKRYFVIYTDSQAQTYQSGGYICIETINQLKLTVNNLEIEKKIIQKEKASVELMLSQAKTKIKEMEDVQLVLISEKEQCKQDIMGMEIKVEQAKRIQHYFTQEGSNQKRKNSRRGGVLLESTTNILKSNKKQDTSVKGPNKFHDKIKQGRLNQTEHQKDGDTVSKTSDVENENKQKDSHKTSLFAEINEWNNQKNKFLNSSQNIQTSLKSSIKRDFTQFRIYEKKNSFSKKSSEDILSVNSSTPSSSVRISQKQQSSSQSSPSPLPSPSSRLLKTVENKKKEKKLKINNGQVNVKLNEPISLKQTRTIKRQSGSDQFVNLYSDCKSNKISFKEWKRRVFELISREKLSEMSDQSNLQQKYYDDRTSQHTTFINRRNNQAGVFSSLHKKSSFNRTMFKKSTIEESISRTVHAKTNRESKRKVKQTNAMESSSKIEKQNNDDIEKFRKVNELGSMNSTFNFSNQLLARKSNEHELVISSALDHVKKHKGMHKKIKTSIEDFHKTQVWEPNFSKFAKNNHEFTKKDLLIVYQSIENAYSIEQSLQTFSGSKIKWLRSDQGLYPAEISYLNQFFTIMAKIHLFNPQLYEKLQLFLLTPYDSVISQMNVLKVNFNTLLTRQALRSIIMVHRKCVTKNVICKHLKYLVSKVFSFLEISNIKSSQVV